MSKKAVCSGCNGTGKIYGPDGRSFTCQVCNGKGIVPFSTPGTCPYCHGKGKVKMSGRWGTCVVCNGTGRA